MQLRIGQKISAGFAIILVLLLVISLVTIFSTRSISNEVQGLSHVYNQLALESEIESEFDRAVAGIRGYVAYGTNNFQEDYNVSMGKVMNAENELLAVVGGEKKPEVQKLIEATQTYHQSITGELIPAIERHYQDADSDSMVEAQRLGASLVQVTNRQKEIVDNLFANNQIVFDQGIAATNEGVLGVVRTTLVLGGLALLLGLGLGFFTTRSVRNTIKALLDESNRLIGAARAGKLRIRGDAEKINPEFRGIILGMNDTLDAVIEPLDVAAEYVDRIARGDTPPKITAEYKGDFNKIKNNLNTCIDTVEGLLKETDRLIVAVGEGRLDTRGNEAAFNGDWARLVSGMNGMMEAVARPVNELVSVMGRIAVNDYTTNMTGVYAGAWNNLKDSTNNVHSQFVTIRKIVDNVSRGDLIDLEELKKVGRRSENDQLIPSLIRMMEAIRALVADADMLAAAAVEGRLDIRADSNKHSGDFNRVIDGVNKTLDAVIGPLNMAAEYIDRITEGNTPPKITDEYKGDFNEIKNNLNKCIDTISLLVDEVGVVIAVGREGKLDQRANSESTQGVWRKLLRGINDAMDGVTGPLKVAAEYVELIAKGEKPPHITGEYKGDLNLIKKNLNTLSDDLGGVLEETEKLIAAVEDGKFSVRANAAAFSGDWGRLVGGMNGMMEAIAKPVDELVLVMGKMAVNDYSACMTGEYEGAWGVLKESANNMCSQFVSIRKIVDNVSRGNLVDIDDLRKIGKRCENDELIPSFIRMMEAIQALVEDAHMLANAAVAGKLDVRADIERHNGDFHKVVAGVNSTLDAVTGPLNKAAEYIERISKGDKPPYITEEYKGDFNLVKNNLNALIDNLSGVLQETEKLIAAVGEGRLDVRGNAAALSGDWGRLVDGMNNLVEEIAEPVEGLRVVLGRMAVNDLTQKIDKEFAGVWNDLKDDANRVVGELRNIEYVSKNIGNGILDDLPELKKIEKRSENDHLLPALIQMMEAIQGLVIDTNSLAEAAVEGRLDVRADVTRHSGEYRQVIHGLNNTLDAVVGPLNVTAEYVDRISKGDIPPRITEEYNGDFNEIKNNLNGCIDTMQGLQKEMNHLIDSVRVGKLDVRGNVAAFAGDWSAILGGMNSLMEEVDKPTSELISVLKLLAHNDFTKTVDNEYTGIWNDLKHAVNTVQDRFAAVVNTVTRISHGDLGELKFFHKVGRLNENDQLIPGMTRMIEAIQSLADDANNLAQAAVEGRLDARAETAKHEGEYRRVVEGMNNTLDAIIGPLNIAAEYIERISKGDIPPQITESYNGDFNEVKNNLNGCIDNISGVLQETNRLVLAIREGQLDVQGDMTAFEGDWGRLIGGMNGMVEAVAEPVGELRVALGRIAVYDLTKKIDKEYAGVWNDLKGDANQVIVQLGNIERVSRNVGNGDLGDLAKLKQIGRRSENDNLMPAYIQMMEAIQGLVIDTNSLAEAAVEGRLDVRADASRHAGEYREVIHGLNNTLDAVVGPLNVTAEYIDQIAKGIQPPKITDEYKGDFNEIKDNLNACIDSLNNLAQVVEDMIKAIKVGNLEARSDKTAFEGGWRYLVGGLNEMMDAVENPVDELIAVMGQITMNDYSKKIEKDYSGAWLDLKTATNTVCGRLNDILGTVVKVSNGDLTTYEHFKKIGRRSEKDEMVPGLIKMHEAITGLVEDADMLAGAAVEGRLDARADASRHTGEYRRVVEGMNGLMEEIAEPVGELRAALGRMAVIDLTQTIDTEYAGVWNDLKDDANMLIEQLRDIGRVSKNISNGVLSDLAGLRQIGQRSENDQLTPAYIQMMEAIQGLVDDTNNLAEAAVEGKLDVRADVTRHVGGYRKAIDGLNKTLDAVVHPINETAACLQEMAAGNLDVAVTGDYQGDHAMIKNALNGTLEEINEVMGQIIIAVEQVNTGALQVSDSSQALSQGAAESASTMEQLTSSMNEINSQTRQNAENAMQANQLATKARDVAEKGNRQMAEMVQAMGEINESSSNISKIIKVIDDIAFQTNILALNAAVEAARAGKHGKGFTVVAEEVRNLAQRSANAAKETAEMIESSIEKTEMGAKIAAETSKALEEIVQGTAKVTDLIGEIASASKEQAGGISQINEGLNQVDQVTQQNSAGSEELAAASEEMSSQSAMVTEMLGKFKLRKQQQGERHGMAHRPSDGGHRHPAHKQADSKQVPIGVLEAATATATATDVKPEDVISLNDTEFGGF